MLLTRLVLHNYSVFEGRCELQLTTSETGRNVTIIGGKNGAGKTSLLEGIRLCLYGGQGVAKRQGREYKAFLQSRVNKGAVRNSPYCSSHVEIEFAEEVKGKRNSYTIRRSWSSTGEDEAFYIAENGRELGLERDYWPDFLRLLIPPGVAQFFIFDGERIQEIATEDGSGQTIVEGIESLLGLDTFKHLETDLDTFARQKLRSEAAQATQADYMRIEAEREESRQNLSLAETDLEDVEQEIASFDQQKAELEQKISKDYGARVQDRPRLLQEKAAIEEQLKAVSEQFQEMCSNLLPFSMIADLGIELEGTLDRERKTVNWHAAKEATYPQLQKLLDLLLSEQSPQPNPELTVSQRDFLHQRLKDCWSSLFEPPPSDVVEHLVHELPQAVEGSIRQILQKSRGELSINIRDLLDRRERLASRHRSLELELNRLPAGDDVDQDLFRQISNINQTLGRLKEKRSDLEDKCEKYKQEIKDSDRRLAATEEMVQMADAAKKQVDLCKKIKLVLQDYLKSATGRRVSTLETNVESMLRKLVRKDDLVAKLSIDPRNFNVTLSDSHGEVLRKADLSAGEKEIYAICLLWGLAKTSGRELPIVIDTPLSRLDSDHRKAIVERYYPEASKQVIILSTDTEVDREYYKLLAPHVNEAFLLDYDTREGRTKIRQGYFW